MLGDLIMSLCITIGGADLVCDIVEEPPAPLPSDSSALHFDFDSVKVKSPPVVKFCVTNEKGDPVHLTQDDISSGALRFGLAKLIPGSNGDADSWQSYINTVEVATPDVGPDGAAVLESALQATTETRSNAGKLKNKGDGCYSYKFRTDVTDPDQTMGVTYEPSLTHRLVMQVEFEGSDGEEIVTNPYFDFRPDGGPIETTKLVVHKDTCNQCHHELALHGGGRIEMEYCVACHNPGTTDANSGNNLDFSVMTHKIHQGVDLNNLPYTIWGFRDSEHDYSNVVYPQDHRNCVKCHSAEDPNTPDGDNWKLRPTMESCGSCHDDTDFDNHPDTGIVQEDNLLCGQCHVPFSSKLYFAIENAHVNPIDALAEQFQFNIHAIDHNPLSRQVVVDFSVTDPTDSNQAYDIENDPAFTAGAGASRMAILVGWDTDDFNNKDSGSDPALPISLDPLFGGATNIGDNVFRVSATLPAAASGTGIVGIEGHPAVEGVRIPVTNTFEYFPITDQEAQPRREIVSLEKCNTCHGNLSLHGNNRQGAIEVCTICHNPNATDIEVRPATVDANNDGEFDDFTAVGIDGKREESIHFKNMIHSIHAGAAEEHGFKESGIVVYGFRRSIHDYSHVRYPGILSNCDACHVDGSYRVNATAGSLATTIETAAADLDGFQDLIEQALADPADDINISTEMSTCFSCHDTEEAIDHMEFVGGGDVGTEDYLNNNVFEDCGGCHGPMEFKDVADVHGLASP